MHMLSSLLASCGPMPGMNAGVNDDEEQHQTEQHSDTQGAAGTYPAVGSTRGASTGKADRFENRRSGPAVRDDKECAAPSVGTSGQAERAARHRLTTFGRARRCEHRAGTQGVPLMSSSHMAASKLERSVVRLTRDVPAGSSLPICPVEPLTGLACVVLTGLATRTVAVLDDEIRFPLGSSVGIACGGTGTKSSWLASGSITATSREGDVA